MDGLLPVFLSENKALVLNKTISENICGMEEGEMFKGDKLNRKFIIPLVFFMTFLKT